MVVLIEMGYEMVKYLQKPYSARGFQSQVSQTCLVHGRFLQSVSLTYPCGPVIEPNPDLIDLGQPGHSV